MKKNIFLCLGLATLLTSLSGSSQAVETCRSSFMATQIKGIALPNGRPIILETNWFCSGNEQAIAFSLLVRGDDEAVLVAKTTDVPPSSTDEEWTMLMRKTAEGISPIQAADLIGGGPLSFYISKYKSGEMDRAVLEKYFTRFIKKAIQL